MSLSEQLNKMKVGRKSRRLEEIWPQVEQRLVGGATLTEVLRLLNADGFDLTLGTLKSYVHRLRKKEKHKGVAPASGSPTPAARTNDAATSAPTAPGQRPRTFNFDPRGNPDLLK